MSVLTTFEAVPGRLLSLYEVLFHQEKGMDEAILKASATPRSLRSKDATQLFSNPYSEARNMGMVVTDGTKIRLTDEARRGGKPKGDHETHFRLFLRSVFFEQERSNKAQQSKFALALSWFLTRNPLTPIRFTDPVVDQVNLEIENGARILELSTASNSQNLLYWARYLGFATMYGVSGDLDETNARRAIPNPCKAIEEVLDEVFNSPGELDSDISCIDCRQFTLASKQAGPARNSAAFLRQAEIVLNINCPSPLALLFSVSRTNRNSPKQLAGFLASYP